MYTVFHQESESQDHIDQLFEALPWKVSYARKFPQEHHVNIQELSAVSHQLKHLVQTGHYGIRHICGSDSQVAIGAWSKGRSSSRQWNKIL